MKLKIGSLYKSSEKDDYILPEFNDHSGREIFFDCPFFVLQGPMSIGEEIVEYKVLLSDGYLGYLQIYSSLPEYIYSEIV